MTGSGTGTGAAAIAAAIAAGPGWGCAVEAPQCPIADGMVYLEAARGTTVFFLEQRGADLPPRAFLVDCRDSRGVMVTGADGILPIPALSVLSGAMEADAQPSGGAVRRELDALGVDAARVRLGAGHCGCDLPSLEPPPSSCPEM